MPIRYFAQSRNEVIETLRRTAAECDSLAGDDPPFWPMRHKATALYWAAELLDNTTILNGEY